MLAMSTLGASFVLDDEIISKIELMYSSCGTEVFVCRSPASLYFESNPLTTACADSPTTSSPESGDESLDSTKWQFVTTGVPTLVFDKGTSICRRRKKLQIVLANCRTGFLIFTQTLTDRSYYRKSCDSGDTFHIFLLDDPARKSTGAATKRTTATNNNDAARSISSSSRDDDHLHQSESQRPRGRGQSSFDRRVPKYRSVGLRFDRADAAKEFYDRVQDFEHKLCNYYASVIESAVSVASFGRKAILGRSKSKNYDKDCNGNQQRRVPIGRHKSFSKMSRDLPIDTQIERCLTIGSSSRVGAEDGGDDQNVSSNYSRAGIRKVDISEPILFRHVTSVKIDNPDLIF